MNRGPELRSPRLLLRRWRESDCQPFAAMNAEPAVFGQLAGPMSREQSDALITRIEDGFGAHGFGLWAVELASTGAFLGFTGLSVPAFAAPFLPAVEVGWRLVPTAWGHGYATEAARAALSYGAEIGLAEVVSFTAETNVRSRAVMRRLGMTTDPAEDFDHPMLPVGHHLRRHVLYRLSAPHGPGAPPVAPRTT